MAQDQQLTKMKHISLSGDLKVSKFRSVYWNVLLGVLKSTPDTWLEQRRKQRQYFKELKLKYNFNPKSLDLDQDNPLSQSQDSVWNQHFRDQELLSLIRQDVIRTNPSVDFYRKENIQEIMVKLKISLFTISVVKQQQFVFVQQFYLFINRLTYYFCMRESSLRSVTDRACMKFWHHSYSFCTAIIRI